jgi:cysteine desulfurase
MPEIYLDHHAPSLRVSQDKVAAVDAAAKTILTSLGADGSIFLFTSNGAEAVSQVLSSVYLEVTRETGRNHFLTTGIEDFSILMGLKHLKKLDCQFKMLAVDDMGRLCASVLSESITPKTVMLSVSLANPLTGVIQPIADLARVCKEKEILLHVDISCTFGKIFFSFKDFGIDFLTFDAPLLGAPKPAGGLLVSEGLSIVPLIHGNPAFNTEAFLLLSEAMSQGQTRLDHVCTETARLRAKLEEGIKERVPDAILPFQEADRLPNVATAIFPKIASELLAFHLQRKGVFASFGGEASQHLSSILKTCGVRSDLALSALSFALSHTTKEAEIEETLSILEETAKELRKIYET